MRVGNTTAVEPLEDGPPRYLGGSWSTVVIEVRAACSANASIVVARYASAGVIAASQHRMAGVTYTPALIREVYLNYESRLRCFASTATAPCRRKIAGEPSHKLGA